MDRIVLELNELVKDKEIRKDINSLIDEIRGELHMHMIKFAISQIIVLVVLIYLTKIL